MSSFESQQCTKEKTQESCGAGRAELPSLFCEGCLNSRQGGRYPVGDKGFGWCYFPPTPTPWILPGSKEAPSGGRAHLHQTLPPMLGKCLLTRARLTLNQGSWPFLQKTSTTSTHHVPSVLKIQCFKITPIVLVELSVGLLFFLLFLSSLFFLLKSVS